MVLSEETRRWNEIRFYYFCFELFHMNKDMVDVILAIDAIAQIGKLNLSAIKRIAGLLLNDRYYYPNRNEILLLGNMHGMKSSELAEFLGTSIQSISRSIRNLKNSDFKTNPKLDATDDNHISQFLTVLDNFKKVGI